MNTFLTKEQSDSLEILLSKGFTYSSALHASLSYGNDIEKSLKFLSSPLRDKIQIFGQGENHRTIRISFVLNVEESKKTTLLALIDLLEKKLNTWESLSENKTKKIEVNAITSYFPSLGRKDNFKKHKDFFWGKGREKSVYELSHGKENMFLIFAMVPTPKRQFIMDYGDDPFQSKTWCKFLQEFEKNEDSHSSFSEGDYSNSSKESIIEKCPIYKVLKDRDVSGNCKISINSLWHFTEYFHGTEDKRPICPGEGQRCNKMERLSKGGYSLTDLRHSTVFRHPHFRRNNAMLAAMNKLNPITFISNEMDLPDLFNPIGDMEKVLSCALFSEKN